MEDDYTPPRSAAPTRAQVRGYVEEMTLELAQMASACGETALSASLALVSIQAGAAARVREGAG